MARHFGLKAMSMAERSESIRLPDASPVAAMSTVPSPSLSPSETPEAKLSGSGPDYARANREGSGGDDLTTAVHKHLTD